ncbi:MAG TPA: glycosyltransferase family 4 protein [Thermodesulfobacteriota bacterium]
MSRRLRILWLSHMLPHPPVSGALQRAFHLLAGAAAAHDVTLVSFTQRSLLRTREEVAAAVRALEPRCREVVVCDVPSDRSRAARAAALLAAGLSTRPFMARRFASRAFTAEVARVAAATRFDLVHVDTIGLAPYADLVPGVPFALDHHNVESHLAGRRAAATRPGPARLYLAAEAAKLAALERRYARAAAVNLVCSALDAERLSAVAPGARTAVVPNGTDPARLGRPRRAPEPGHLLFVGGLSWFPNANGLRWFLREVWPVVRASRGDARLTVVGADPPPDLRRAASADSRIVLAGRVEDVAPAFARAAAFVCPILDGGGTRLKVLDALAARTPVVSTTLGCEGLDLEPERHYLAADDAATFARQTLRLLADPGLADALAEAGRRVVVDRFAWPRIIPRQLDAYEAAVAHPRGQAFPFSMGSGLSIFHTGER